MHVDHYKPTRSFRFKNKIATHFSQLLQWKSNGSSSGIRKHYTDLNKCIVFFYNH